MSGSRVPWSRFSATGPMSGTVRNLPEALISPKQPNPFVLSVYNEYLIDLSDNPWLTETLLVFKSKVITSLQKEHQSTDIVWEILKHFMTVLWFQYLLNHWLTKRITLHSGKCTFCRNVPLKSLVTITSLLYLANDVAVYASKLSFPETAVLVTPCALYHCRENSLLAKKLIWVSIIAVEPHSANKTVQGTPIAARHLPQTVQFLQLWLVALIIFFIGHGFLFSACAETN